MRFVAIRDFRTKSAGIWEKLAEDEEIVVTNHGKPIALLSPVRDTNLEATLKELRAARMRTAVTKLREDARSAGTDTMSMSALNKVIEKTRKSGRTRR